MRRMRITQSLKFMAASLASCFLVAEANAERISGFRSLNNKAHGYKIVNNPVRAGKASQRFEVRAGDCGRNKDWNDCATDRERSEISVRKKWNYGSKLWIAYSVYVPNDFKASANVSTTVGQIHQKGGPKGSAGGFKSFPPLLQLNFTSRGYFSCVHLLKRENGKLVDNCGINHLSSIDAMRGKWTDIEILLDTKGKQLLEVYVNGTRKVQRTDFIKFKPKHYWFKYGIYRTFVSKHGGPMPTQVLYIDEVRMGKSRNSVSVQSNKPTD